MSFFTDIVADSRTRDNGLRISGALASDLVAVRSPETIRQDGHGDGLPPTHAGVAAAALQMPRELGAPDPTRSDTLPGAAIPRLADANASQANVSGSSPAASPTATGKPSHDVTPVPRDAGNVPEHRVSHDLETQEAKRADQRFSADPTGIPGHSAQGSPATTESPSQTGLASGGVESRGISPHWASAPALQASPVHAEARPAPVVAASSGLGQPSTTATSSPSAAGREIVAQGSESEPQGRQAIASAVTTAESAAPSPVRAGGDAVTADAGGGAGQVPLAQTGKRRQAAVADLSEDTDRQLASAVKQPFPAPQHNAATQSASVPQDDGPHVHIGQVDIFIQTPSSTGAAPREGRSDLASRLYLRTL